MTTGAKTGPQRRAILAGALAALGCAGARPAMAGAGLMDLSIVDRETGQRLRVWQHRGRAYVAGRPGARYAVRVRNNSGGRVLVVPSVDGVNVLTGETAGYQQRGYILGPYESYDITGWRKSNSQIAAFNFAALSKSYAARTGRPGDVGVIGIAVFRERTYAPPVALESSRAPDSMADESVVSGVDRRAAAAAPQARREEKLGTGHGAREWSSVTEVAFERATPYPAFIRQIEYDTYANLAALGVIPRQPAPPPRPRPFPTEPGYVPDPPGMP